jgi:hypothetical protein
MKKILILALLLSAQAQAETIIAPNGDVTYITESASGYTAINATTNESTFYSPSGGTTAVIGGNGMDAPETYIIDRGDVPALIELNTLGE